MSKFGEISTSGGNNQFGDGGTQNNTVNYNQYNSRKEANGDEMPGIVMSGAIAVAAALWWFFLNYEKIYFVLFSMAGCSFILMAIGLLIAAYSRDLNQEDWVSNLGVLVMICITGFLIEYSGGHAPKELSDLAHGRNVIEFWMGLSGYGKKIALETFLSALLVGLVSVFTLATSLKISVSALSYRWFPSLWGWIEERFSFLSAKLLFVIGFLFLGLALMVLMVGVPEFSG